MPGYEQDPNQLEDITLDWLGETLANEERHYRDLARSDPYVGKKEARKTTL